MVISIVKGRDVDSHLPPLESCSAAYLGTRRKIGFCRLALAAPFDLYLISSSQISNNLQLSNHFLLAIKLFSTICEGEVAHHLKERDGTYQ